MGDLKTNNKMINLELKNIQYLKFKKSMNGLYSRLQSV